eukprot:8030271-Pyramimonas_sp.AAC.1
MPAPTASWSGQEDAEHQVLVAKETKARQARQHLKEVEAELGAAAEAYAATKEELKKADAAHLQEFSAVAGCWPEEGGSG